MSLLKRTGASSELVERVTRLETIHDNMAPRTWVQDILKPIEQSILRMEQTVSRQAEESKILRSLHEHLLTDRAGRDRAESEAKILAIEEQHAQAMKAAENAAANAEARAASAGALHWIEKKASPVLGFIGALFGVLAVLAGGLAWWIANYVLPSVHALNH